MVAIKAQHVTAFLRSADPNIDAVLVFGPDAGMVTERAGEIAKRFADRDKPPGEILRIEDPDLETDPDRLVVELETLPMFGGRKVIRTTASRRVSAALLKPMLEGSGPLAGALVVEAGSLKPDDAMRALFERLPRAAALPCYADESADLQSLVAATLRAARIEISPEAKQLLSARLGADRGMTRGELEKLVLYCSGKSRIEADDVEAIVGDASEQTLDRVLVAMASGQLAPALNELDRAIAAGDNPQMVILWVQRYLQRLHRVKAMLQSGRSLDDALRTLRPPLHFKQRDTFATQVRSWTIEQLETALSRTAIAAKAARLSSSLEAPLAERLVMEIAQLARRASAR